MGSSSLAVFTSALWWGLFLGYSVLAMMGGGFYLSALFQLHAGREGLFPWPSIAAVLKRRAFSWVFDLSLRQRDSFVVLYLIPEGVLPAPKKFSAVHWVTARPSQQDLDFNPLGGRIFLLALSKPWRELFIGHSTSAQVHYSSTPEEFPLSTLFQPCSWELSLGAVAQPWWGGFLGCFNSVLGYTFPWVFFLSSEEWLFFWTLSQPWWGWETDIISALMEETIGIKVQSMQWSLSNENWT